MRRLLLHFGFKDMSGIRLWLMSSTLTWKYLNNTILKLSHYCDRTCVGYSQYHLYFPDHICVSLYFSIFSLLLMKPMRIQLWYILKESTPLFYFNFYTDYYTNLAVLLGPETNKQNILKARFHLFHLTARK